MSILAEIVDHKLSEVKRAMVTTPREQLPPRIGKVRDFLGAISNNQIDVIAEIKLQSPSSGSIRPGADPAELAISYFDAGAAALSVLTDAKYFGGHLDHLRAVHHAVGIPVLRKDFIITDYQVYESYSAGADAILLIADAVPPQQLRSLYDLAASMNLHVLMEGYSDESLATICDIAPRIVGLNSRDLKSMSIDLEGMAKRIKLLPGDAIKVAESGIQSRNDLNFVATAGFDAALIGSSLLAQPDPGDALKTLLSGVTQGIAE